MTKQEQFVYNTITNLALNQGVSRKASTDAAREGAVRYRRHQFKKIDQLVKDQVAKAKKVSEE